MATGRQFVFFTGSGTGAQNSLNAPDHVAARLRVQTQFDQNTTVIVEHTIDGTNWKTLVGKKLSDTTAALVASIVNTNDIYEYDVTGSTAIRAYPSAGNAGTGVVTGTLVAG